MKKRMLIDANHPEETRVVVLDGSRVEEFDFEAASRRPLKGNIYLAKVTRVEPSLQAAFVEYGGNRQGFLAFSEIHPDYYQIPFADRQALIAEQEADARRRSEDDIESFEISAKRDDSEDEKEESAGEDSEIPADEEEGAVLDAATIGLPESSGEEGAVPAEETAADSVPEDGHDEIFVNHVGRPDEEPDDDRDEDEAAEDLTKADAALAHEGDYAQDSESQEASVAEENEGEIQPVSPAENGDGHNGDMAAEAAEDNEGAIEPVTPEGASENAEAALQSQRPPQKWVRRKHYKIQEVIKRRQIILVQVVKEERGNKGAALTTYLSLAGRYCVLMPNTPRGGGISRKITNAADRKRLKSAAQGLELPEGMGLIIRTAGENRSKLEIRRDYEYLMRLWDTIREKTLSSNAPANVYEEGDLIKRVIRDLYTKDVQDVVVEGERGYRNAKDFMRMLMPGHARNVHQYRDTVPLFQRMHIESQLDAMFSPTVTLKSGGYIVINQTEALVSIDVNSGRATREHSIEETARKTNLEAADEVGRQLRLRDLAGLIVIDFIDMEEGRNDREVEKRLRDAVKNDRARVQIGKISQFGLLEMSRQRLRAGVLAGSTVTCPHCGGAGIVRSVESTTLRLLRALEEEGEKNRASAVTVKVASDIALYALNQKRRELARIEAEYGMEISFEPKEGLLAGSFELERTRVKDPGERPRSSAVGIEAGFVRSDEPEDDIPPEEDEEESEEEFAGTAEGSSEVENEPRPRDEQREEHQGEHQGEHRDGRKRRRRGGRGRGRERGPRPEGADIAHAAVEASAEAATDVQAHPAAEHRETVQPIHNGQAHGGGQDGVEGEHRRKRRRRRGRRGGRDRQPGQPVDQHIAIPNEAQRFGSAPDEIDTTPSSGNYVAPGAPSAPVWSMRDDVPDTTPKDEPAKPAKKGWWQRTFSGE
ncbi:MAG TPA: Rne/Rng family ribonuclease [Rhizomicrobium sp.]|nr:Rne/Rng family ribonuclease [Rhizomicrobium sp.]